MTMDGLSIDGLSMDGLSMARRRPHDCTILRIFVWDTDNPPVTLESIFLINMRYINTSISISLAI